MKHKLFKLFKRRSEAGQRADCTLKVSTGKSLKGGTVKHKLFKLFKHRLLDGFIGILGFVMHYRVLATYGDVTLFIFHVSIRKLLYLSIQSHSLEEYPPITFQLDLLTRTIINTAAKAQAEINQQVTRWSQEREDAKQAAAKELEETGRLELAKQYAKEIL